MTTLALVAVGGGLIVGGLTSPAQGWLSDEVSSLANSAGPWSLVAFAIALLAVHPLHAAWAATISLASMEFGYVIVTELRGGSNASSTVRFWIIAALLAGPALGIAASWARQRLSIVSAAGLGVLAGVLVGEGIYGLREIADTTNTTYWTIEIILGVLVVVIGLWIKRRHDRVDLLLPLASAVVATALSATVLLAAASVAG